MTQTRIKENLTAPELAELLERSEAEIESLRKQLIDSQAVIERREAVIKVLESDIANLELQLEAVGAGGVSAQRITGSRP